MLFHIQAISSLINKYKRINKRSPLLPFYTHLVALTFESTFENEKRALAKTIFKINYYYYLLKPIYKINFLVIIE